MTEHHTRWDVFVILLPIIMQEIVLPLIRMAIILAAIYFLASALFGCARPPELIVPPSLLTCADQPKSPADQPGVTQRDVSLYIVDLAVAGADCRRNLNSVRRILTPEPTK